ncbi:MAG: hypothetical protein HQL20_01305 [Candidatus Omnitrophica bacterium]|nr:hypothetical protein [Candidatus Omnitrophota bacterium]
MTSDQPASPKAVLSRRAQAIIELAVFGSIFIFVVGSIFQQGYASMEYQQAQLQPMRMALLKSYMATKYISKDSGPEVFKRQSVSIHVVQDRLSPGLAKYGAVDRRPAIMSGSGSLTTGLMYPVEWIDVSDPKKNAIGVTELTVNGQTFELTGSAAYVLRLRKKPDGTVTTTWFYDAEKLPICEEGRPFVDNQKAFARLKREWPAGQAAPTFFAIKANGNKGWFDAEATAADSDKALYDWKYNYNRNDFLTDDLWSRPNLRNERLEKALWRWELAGDVNAHDGENQNEQADVNGDLVEESVFSAAAKDTSKTKCEGEAVFDLAIQDYSAGDMAGEGPERYDNARDVPGLKMDAQIFTELKDGTVMEIRNGQAFLPNTNKLAMSVNKKKQRDFISRTWQLNRQMIDPWNFVERNPGSVEAYCQSEPSTEEKPLYPQLTPPAEGGCCMNTVADLIKTKRSVPNVLLTCFDMNSRTLFIRSRLTDERGRMWIRNIDTERTEKLLGVK